jgi:hypothetical protein
MENAQRHEIVGVKSLRIVYSSKGLNMVAFLGQLDASFLLTHPTKLVLGLSHEPRAESDPVFVIASSNPAATLTLLLRGVHRTAALWDNGITAMLTT